MAADGNNNQDDNNLEAFVNHDEENINQETLRRRAQMARFKESLKETYTDMFGGAAGWFKEYFMTVGRGLSVPFAIASAVRRKEDGDPIVTDDSGDHENAQFTGGLTCYVGYMALGVGEVGVLIESALNQNSDWKYALIPVATNLVDWLIYEPVRTAFNEAKEERGVYRR
jgi:hypothetical protein